MQPCEAALPIDDGVGVPWIPIAGELIPIQRVPRGLPAPGATGPTPFAHGESGGVQVGFFCFWMIRNFPRGVGYADMPTATRKVRHSFAPRYRVSVRLARLMTMFAPMVVAAGRTRFDGMLSVSVVRCMSARVSGAIATSTLTASPIDALLTLGLALR